MRAAYIEQTGPPEAIVVGDLPRPKPGPGQSRQGRRPGRGPARGAVEGRRSLAPSSTTPPSETTS